MSFRAPFPSPRGLWGRYTPCKNCTPPCQSSRGNSVLPTDNRQPGSRPSSSRPLPSTWPPPGAAVSLARCEAPAAPRLGKLGLLVESEQLHSTFAMDALRSFIQSTRPDALMAWFRRCFGQKVPQSAFQQLRAAVLAHTLPQPRIVLVAGGIQGHEAAYDSKASTILIDRDLVLRARQDNDEAWLLLVCLAEEFGHHLDHLLRTRYSKLGGDAPQDEGARVAYTLVNFGGGQPRSRIPFARYVSSEGTVGLEVQVSGRATAINQYLNTTEQQVDAKSGALEFFGAGRGKGALQGSYGHESIEDSLAKVGFSTHDRQLVYFGNWLRDYSQLVDPKVVRYCLSREALTAIVDVLAQLHFLGDQAGTSTVSTFRVNSSLLGVYRNEEHIDNPKGLESAKTLDPAFRGDCTQVELAVNPDLKMKNFIRSGRRTQARPPREYKVKDGDSLASLAQENGITWQELARFNFGTDIKSEVSKQLFSKVGCRKPTADGKSYIFTSNDKPGIILIPGSAGTDGPEAPYSAFKYLSDQLRVAVRSKKTPKGLIHFGNALHTLEDFFSHTNFIELALIHLGTWVEPWVPAKGVGANARRAYNLTLTSGKFGFVDTLASLLMGLVKVLEAAKECEAGKPTAATKIVLIILKDRGYILAHESMRTFLEHLHELEKKWPWLATLSCKLFAKLKRLAKGQLAEFMHHIAGYIDEVQTAFLEDASSDDPTHTQLAKDHDDHPLHALAATLAQGAVEDVGRVMQRAWAGRATEDEVVLTASRYFLHPTQVDVKGSAGWMLTTVEKWMRNPANKSALGRLGSKSWVQHQLKEAREHVEELRKTARELVLEK